MLSSVSPTASERTASLPGDGLVSPADVVMDRAFTVDAPPAEAWPWLVQLGKRRAGWYFPSYVERLVPTSRRGLRHLAPALQQLAVGDVIPDWGGAGATFTAVEVEPARTSCIAPPGAAPSSPGASVSRRRGRVPASTCGSGWPRCGTDDWPSTSEDCSTCSRSPAWPPVCARDLPRDLKSRPCEEEPISAPAAPGSSPRQPPAPPRKGGRQVPGRGR